MAITGVAVTITNGEVGASVEVIPGVNNWIGSEGFAVNVIVGEGLTNTIPSARESDAAPNISIMDSNEKRIPNRIPRSVFIPVSMRLAGLSGLMEEVR